MTKNTFMLFHRFLLFTALLYSFAKSDYDGRKLHIVYMGALIEGQISPSSQHMTMLQQVVDGSSIEDVLVRSYGRSFNGFAAMLTEKEVQQLSSMKGVVSVFPSKTLQLQTTRSWDYVGLNESSIRRKTIESDIIIGVIDTGIWFDSKSFNDEGFSPPPKKWKGTCKDGIHSSDSTAPPSCNNKIIGARSYVDVSVIDGNGHGTHTASTAAGNYVSNINLEGIANGTVKGGVPSARIAVYQVCEGRSCADKEILAAFDDAIADGVDIITISIGTSRIFEFYQDSIAIGAFHAMEKGVLTAHAAGNEGRKLTSSVAPWLFSIAASSTDRCLVDKIVLGNGKTIVGLAINPTAVKKSTLVLDKDVAKEECASMSTNLCNDACIDTNKVKGKIVLCQDAYGFDAELIQAAGQIIQMDPTNNISSYQRSPKVAVDTAGFDAILSYMKSTKNPEAQILKTEAVKDSIAPVVAGFSSRGPNTIVPHILKPDVSAPGVNILAAYSPISLYLGNPVVDYFILSGTSMACPHGAGLAAYVKTFHPDWSPSAIKSAIMTTASPMDPNVNNDSEFAYGSGHINSVKVTDPGLVYEIQPSDYIIMLCSDGISDEVLRAISGDKNITCPKNSNNLSWKDLNYPSMAINIVSEKDLTVTFNRTVTNVGLANSVYKATVSAKNVSIKIEPNVLSFKALNEKKSFVVTVTVPSPSSLPSSLSSSLIWSDGKHSVRSPIVVYWKELED